MLETHTSSLLFGFISHTFCYFFLFPTPHLIPTCCRNHFHELTRSYSLYGINFYEKMAFFVVTMLILGAQYRGPKIRPKTRPYRGVIVHIRLLTADLAYRKPRIEDMLLPFCVPKTKVCLSSSSSQLPPSHFLHTTDLLATLSYSSLPQPNPPNHPTLSPETSRLQFSLHPTLLHYLLNIADLLPSLAIPSSSSTPLT